MGESGTGFSGNVNWNYFDAQNRYTNWRGASVAFNDDPPVDLNQEAILDALWEGIQNNEVFAIRGETDIKNIYEEMVAGMNFRIINAFGRLTLVSAFGDFGKIMVDPSGGIWSTNLGGAHLADAVVKGSSGGGATWDLNGDGVFQKNEADNWWLSGNGVSVNVDNSKIDWTGLKIPEGRTKGIFSISTTDAFLKLPYETAATYGGTSFKIIGPSQVEVIDQLYHYNYRPNNSLENVIRNFMNWWGKPSGEGTNFMIHYYNPNIWIK